VCRSLLLLQHRAQPAPCAMQIHFHLCRAQAQNAAASRAIESALIEQHYEAALRLRQCRERNGQAPRELRLVRMPRGIACVDGLVTGLQRPACSNRVAPQAVEARVARDGAEPLARPLYRLAVLPITQERFLRDI